MPGSYYLLIFEIDKDATETMPGNCKVPVGKHVVRRRLIVRSASVVVPSVLQFGKYDNESRPCASEASPGPSATGAWDQKQSSCLVLRFAISLTYYRVVRPARSAPFRGAILWPSATALGGKAIGFLLRPRRDGAHIKRRSRNSQ
jgi:hypothetical protein